MQHALDRPVEPSPTRSDRPRGRIFRRLEIGGIALFALLASTLIWRLTPHAIAAPGLFVVAIAGAYVAADLVSGVVHWVGDTWGSERMPVFGPALLRPFREHHVDEKAITRHDFVETNGANCMIALPAALGAVLIPLGPGPWQVQRHFVAMFFTGLILAVMATNQIHKWAHADRPPRPIAMLQTLRLILSPAHHRVHHTAPFTTYYCITTGWWNWPLHKLRVFGFLERVISAATGAVPRVEAPRARWRGLAVLSGPADITTHLRGPTGIAGRTRS